MKRDFGLGDCGVFVNAWGKTAPTADQIADMAVTAETLGFDSLNMGWHAVLPDGGPFAEFDNSVLIDPFVLLPYLAAKTSTLRLGLNSAVLPAQHPFTLAQFFAALDHVSNGRAIAGGAIGWLPEDFQLTGAASSERGARADEALSVMKQLWEGVPIEEPGRFWDTTGLTVGVTPVADPMPLWVGGGVPAIKRAAQWGTALMPLNVTPEFVRDELRPALDAAAEAHGRTVQISLMTYAAVYDDAGETESHLAPMLSRFGLPALVQEGKPEEAMVVGSPEECREQIRAYLEAGVDYIVFDTTFHGLETHEFAVEQWRRLSEVVKTLK